MFLRNHKNVSILESSTWCRKQIPIKAWQLYTKMKKATEAKTVGTCCHYWLTPYRATVCFIADSLTTLDAWWWVRVFCLWRRKPRLLRRMALINSNKSGELLTNTTSKKDTIMNNILILTIKSNGHGNVVYIHGLNLYSLAGVPL